MKAHRLTATPLVALFAIVAGVQAATTELATAPLSGAATNQAKPNILFILDDSLSMEGDALPDWAALATEDYQRKNPGFNGIAYNPAVTYSPPIYYDDSGNPGRYPSQTNSTAVPKDGFRIQSQQSDDLTNVAFYYTTVAGEYCTDKTLRACQAASGPGGNYQVAAPLRWCNSQEAAFAANPATNACRATQTDGEYRYPRMPEPHTSKLTINAGGDVTGIRVGVGDAGQQILAATASGAGPASLAIDIAAKINRCSRRLTGDCSVVGYSASSAGNVVTITAPAAIPVAPVVTSSSTIEATPFGRSTVSGENQAPGDVQLTVITDTRPLYPKASTRSDCVISTSSCSYAEEMTNYANWWAYYRTRMQTMKTSASLSFSTIDATRRVGYMSINNSTDTDFLNVSDFSPTQKRDWYRKLFAARPDGDTPLRVALSNAGHLYAGKMNGQNFNGVAVHDPMQSYCQKNYTILSTDGYWNLGEGFKLDGTPVGDQDGNVDRPQFDGGVPLDRLQVKKEQLQRWGIPTSSTQTLISRTTPLLVETSQLQEQTRPLQARDSNGWTRRFSDPHWELTTSQLQNRITRQQRNVTTDQYRESPLQTQTLTLEVQTQALIQTNTDQVQGRTRNSSGEDWSGWTNVDRCEERLSRYPQTDCRTVSGTSTVEVSTCTPTTSVSALSMGSGDDRFSLYVTGKSCRYDTASSWVPATAACTTQSQSSAGEETWVGPATSCRYNPSQWTAADTCNATPASSASPYTVLTATSCRYGDWSGWNDWTDATNCSALAQDGRPLARQCERRSTGFVDAASCVAVPAPARTTVECRSVVSEWLDTNQACTAGPSTECRYVGRATRRVASCGPQDELPANFVNPIATTCNFVATQELVRDCKGDQDNNVFCNPTTEAGPWTDTDQCSASSALQCQYGAWSDWTNVSTCTPAASGSASGGVSRERVCRYTGSTVNVGWSPVPGAPTTCTNQPEPDPRSPSFAIAVATRCSYPEAATGQWQTAPDGCTATGQTGDQFVNPKTECAYTEPSAYVDDPSCPASAAEASTGPSYTVGVARTCATREGWANTDVCADSDRCRTVELTWQNVDGEAAAVAQTGQTTSYQCCSTRRVPGEAEDGQVCKPAVVEDSTPSCASLNSGATPNTLADVAQYYYLTDLRTPSPGLGNCAPDGDTSRNVCGPPEGAGQANTVQRMVTYTLGLGASGVMQYDENYERAQQNDTSDFASIKWETTANPETGICSWQRSGNCNWPPPANNSQTNIDDLWHAAVNGRGSYFSARDPSTLAAGISSALASISSALGSVAAVTVTSPTLALGGNGVFEVSFEVGVWAGDVVKRNVDGISGVVLPNVVWSAEERLRRKMTNNGTQPADHLQRTIYTYASGATNGLKSFAGGTALSDEEVASLSPADDTLTQFCTSGLTCLSTEQKALARGVNLANFLRGDPTYEGSLYRKRSRSGTGLHRPLGDIAGSEAVYVQAPPWNYVDPGYDTFKQNNSARAGMVYAGANDGMLHAFDAGTGDEAWAYVPRLVFSKLYKLADKAYSDRHEFTVDGTPVIGDIYAGSAWKTILVGGLNSGGRGYYALDITTPGTPKVLWEFSDDNLGYTYGNPVITKLKDGTWVVIFASGYNNVEPGDGVGRLFIVNANTGELLRTISTGVGSTDTPSGLARISAWANFPDLNNTAERVYGGDLRGNLWRFDVNGDIGEIADPRVYDAKRLITLQDANGRVQPITAKPELGKVNNQPVVFVGTGQLLGPGDFATRSRQSFYAIKDKLTDTAYADGWRDSDAFTKRTLLASTCTEHQANLSLCTQEQATIILSGLEQRNDESDEDFAARRQRQSLAAAFGPTNDGWYVDFTDDAERSTTDSSLQRGTIVFNTNRPLPDGECVPRAQSYQYFLNYKNGEAIEEADGIAGVLLADSLATRATVVLRANESERLSSLTRAESPAVSVGSAGSGGSGGSGDGQVGGSGGGSDPTVTKTSEGPQTLSGPVPVAPPKDAARRISWRELRTE